jgi:hypothetical protein
MSFVNGQTDHNTRLLWNSHNKYCSFRLPSKNRIIRTGKTFGRGQTGVLYLIICCVHVCNFRHRPILTTVHKIDSYTAYIYIYIYIYIYTSNHKTDGRISDWQIYKIYKYIIFNISSLFFWRLFLTFRIFIYF